MNILCTTDSCPVILGSTCVFYRGDNLSPTGIVTNDSIQVALQKIDAIIGSISTGGGIWGSITGNILNQTDLITYLSLNFYPLSSNPAGYLTNAVLNVTASLPLSSTGGSNPDISIPQATSLLDGYLSSVDWNTFNNKQEQLVSGINIKTVNGESLLGSGDIAISAGDSGGFKRTFLLMGA